MMAFLSRYFNFIPILLIPVLFFTVWLLPAYGMVLLIVSLSFGLFINSLMIIKKQKETYSPSRTSRIIFVRNVFLEISAIVCTMILAGWLGNYLGEIATRQIYNDLTKSIARLFLGLLIGISVGVIVQRTKKRLLLIFQNRTLVKP